MDNEVTLIYIVMFLLSIGILVAIFTIGDELVKL